MGKKIQIVLGDEDQLALDDILALFQNPPDDLNVMVMPNPQEGLDLQAINLALFDLEISQAQLQTLFEICRRARPSRVMVLMAFDHNQPTVESQPQIEALHQAIQPADEDCPLSGREMEVLALVAKGMTNSEIAAALYVSKNTVGFHLKNIFEKLNVSNRTEATLWYFEYHSSFS